MNGFAGRVRARSFSRHAPKAPYNHLSSPFAIWKRDLSMKLRRIRRRTPQRDWIASYDAGAPDVLERVAAA